MVVFYNLQYICPVSVKGLYQITSCSFDMPDFINDSVCFLAFRIHYLCHFYKYFNILTLGSLGNFYFYSYLGLFKNQTWMMILALGLKTFLLFCSQFLKQFPISLYLVLKLHFIVFNLRVSVFHMVHFVDDILH